MKLKLKDYIHDQELSLTEFIFYFLKNFNKSHDTLNEDNSLQCYKNKHRSLGDITAICKSYYPEATENIVKEILLDFGDDLVGHFCGNIDKRVYELRSNKEYCNWEQGSKHTNDEYLNPINYKEINLNKEKYPKIYEKV